MFTHRAHKDYIFKHTFNVPPLVPLVQYNFKQTIEEKKDIVFFVLLQIRGSNDTTCMCVFHLYSCVSIISQYCYIFSYMSYLYLLSVCVFYIFSISYHSFICYYVIIVTVCILKWKNEGKKLCFSCSMHCSGSIRIYIYIDISCITIYTHPSIFCHPLF